MVQCERTSAMSRPSGEGTCRRARAHEASSNAKSKLNKRFLTSASMAPIIPR